MLPGLLAPAINYLVIPSSGPGGTQRSPHSEDGNSFSEIARSPTFWLLSSFYFFFSIGFWGYLGWMPSYLALSHGVKLTSLGPLASIPYLFSFVGLLITGWLGTGPLAHRRAQLVAFPLFFAAVSLFVAYYAGSLALSLAGLSATAFFLYGANASIAAILLDFAPPKYRATYVGCVSTVAQTGSLIAPALLGILVSRSGNFASGFGAMIVSLCIAAACMLALATPLTRKSTMTTAESIPL